ncbi:hemerythrin domain-containing protein [Defluviitalea raffinosedens]|uniref:hemerythrin domain-containing protein n=1 Tax=Defluviitalea raffinosedens TaxID=1450156 RepID=UPI00195A6B80|nr:hemerythrin domain-containing protein [Defluviitalea raffinosedens]MBM7685842.1 hemerythrin-like domain-containing protein [Defluviitalea raffinosedens]
MDAITLLMEEHKNIKRALTCIRKLCIAILNGKAVDTTLFYQIIDFVRNYADRHHHSKEETILFKKMSDELGERIANGPIYGMLAEHDLGRLFMMNLENALKEIEKDNLDARVDVIANAIAYTDLLHRHIQKEDTAIYTFAQKQLSDEALSEVEAKCKKAEQAAKEKNIQNKYLEFLDHLEEITANL